MNDAAVNDQPVTAVKSRKRRLAIVLLVSLVVVCAITRVFFVAGYYVPSAAMRPTLMENDHFFVNKLVYKLTQPQRGDVIVFRAPYWAASPRLLDEAEAEADGRGLKGAQRERFIRFDYGAGRETTFVKRVIAIPGDVVRITAGRVSIDDREYDHRDLRELLEKTSAVKIADGHVYEGGRVLSDWDLGARAGRPGASVRVTPDPSVGGSVVKIGDETDPRIRPLVIPERYIDGFLAQGHTVKLVDGNVYRDGKVVAPETVAELAGTKGAKVKVMAGVVYLNGKVLSEPFTAEDTDTPYPLILGDYPTPDTSAIVIVKGDPCVKIPPGKLLVMGDNRNDSNDARFWGLLDRERVIGKVSCIYWPVDRQQVVH